MRGSFGPIQNWPFAGRFPRQNSAYPPRTASCPVFGMGQYNRSRERPRVRAGIGVRVSDNRQATSRLRAALFVLGMHRSGTSALAGTLAIVGAKAPRTLMAANDGNARGYWESVRLVELNDEILASAGSHWSDWRPISPQWFHSQEAGLFKTRATELLDSEYGTSPTFVIKDPRACRLVPFWVDVLRAAGAEPKIIVPLRSPLEVAHSLRHIHGIPLPNGLLLWLRHVLEAERESRAFARSFTTWRQFLSDPHLCLKNIGDDLGIAFPALSDSTALRVDEFLSDDLLHFRVGKDDLDAHPDVHAWVKTAYRTLESLVQDRHSSAAMGVLDEILATFDAATSMFGRVVAKGEADVARLREEGAARERRIADLEPLIAAAQADSAALESSLRAGNGRIGELER